MRPDEVVTLQLADLHPEAMERFLRSLMDRAAKLTGEQNFDFPCTVSFLDGDGNPWWVLDCRRNGDEASDTWLLKPDPSRLPCDNSAPGFFVTMEDRSGKKVLMKVVLEGQRVN